MTILSVKTYNFSALILFSTATLFSSTLLATESAKTQNDCSYIREDLIQNGPVIDKMVQRSVDIYAHWGGITSLIGENRDERNLLATSIYREVEPGEAQPIISCFGDPHGRRIFEQKSSDNVTGQENGRCDLSRMILYKFRSNQTGSLFTLHDQIGDFGAEVHTHLECTTQGLGQCNQVPIEIVFRGTENVSPYDWINNIGQVEYKISPYYELARRLVRDMRKSYPNRPLHISGHSLGGGLALYSAAEIQNVFIVTLNAAGIRKDSSGIWKQYMHSKRVLNFVAYDPISKNTDLLDAVNRLGTAGLSNKLAPAIIKDLFVRFDKTYYIPVNTPTLGYLSEKMNALGNFNIRLELHKSGPLLGALSKELKLGMQHSTCSDLRGIPPTNGHASSGRDFIQKRSDVFYSMYWRPFGIVDRCDRRMVVVENQLGQSQALCKSTGAKATIFWDADGKVAPLDMHLEKVMDDQPRNFVSNFISDNTVVGQAAWGICNSLTSDHDSSRRFTSRVSNKGTLLKHQCIKGSGQVVFSNTYTILDDGHVQQK